MNEREGILYSGQNFRTVSSLKENAGKWM